jgi:hypothetical protein
MVEVVERRGATSAAPIDAGPALAVWRAADASLKRKRGVARQAHERAVAVALSHLGAFASVDALARHHTIDRYRRTGEVAAPPIGSVEHWAGEACCAGEGSLCLDDRLIVAAALWRRARELGAR